MRDFLTCLTDRHLEIGGETYAVRPPDVLEGMRVLDAVQSIVAGELDGWPKLEAICRQWLPEGLCNIYFGNQAYPTGTLQDVQELLAAGVKNLQRHRSDMNTVREEMGKRTWFAIIMDFCHDSRTSITDVLGAEGRRGMSFPLFIGLAAEMIRLQARDQANFMIAYASARTGKEAWDNVMKRAGYTKPNEVARVDWKPSEEWVEQQKAKAAALSRSGVLARYGSGKPGKA